MRNLIKSPVIYLNAHEVKSPKHSSVEVEKRPFYALTYRKSGTVKLHMNNKTVVSKENCITLTPKNQAYQTEVIEDTHILVIHFDCLEEDFSEYPFVFECPNQRIFELFELTVNKYSSDMYSNYECFSYFYQLIAEIQKDFETKNESNINHKISKAKTEIENNYSDSDFNIDKLVLMLNVSSSYLRKEFKKAYSVTPIAYLKNIRHQKALTLLATNDYSIEDIALNCGYSSASYFIQDFHKYTGFSPARYKQRYLNI